LEDALRSAQPAGDAVAHVDLVAPDRLKIEEAVERRHLLDRDRRHLEVLGHGLHELRREPAAVLALHDRERCEQRRALAVRRKLRDPAVDLGARTGGEALGRLRFGLRTHQRSISPNTMSCVPMIATRSAIMWPRAISSSAARCANPGARIFTRYGLFAPSDTIYTPNSPFGASTAAYASPSGTQ